MVLESWRRTPPSVDIEHVEPPVVRKLFLANEIKIVDIREEWEYELHHIPGSILVPMDVITFILPRFNFKKIAIVCEHGNRSTRLVNGFPGLFKGMKVYNMLGGIDRWIKLGYEVACRMDENGTLYRRFLNF